MCFAYVTKKKLRNVVIGLFFLFGGVEYGWYICVYKYIVALRQNYKYVLFIDFQFCSFHILYA